MCGILGYASLHPIPSDTLRAFSEWLSCLTTRWPDSTGIFEDTHILLWHTRLSIIDTSNAANQPFYAEHLVCIFNGEIYNFQTIRNELQNIGYTFTTSSDTEVLVKSYLARWEECTKKFDGMRALCIYDKKQNTLFLSRDRIGEKPLIYGLINNAFIFWSEIPALIPCIWKEHLSLDYTALAQFNTYNFKHIPAPYTPYHQLKKLQPGYNLTVNLTSLTFSAKKFFQISPISLTQDPVSELHDLLKKSVIQTCYADVPVGILLSWGVDSSLIAALLKDRDISTYSLWYDEFDPEIQRAKRIADHLGVRNTCIYFKDSIKDYNILSLIRENVKQYGEPVNLFQIIYSDILLRHMKKEWIKVVIGWNAADELFYGYDGMNMLYRADSMYSICRLFGIDKIISPAKIKSLLYKYHLSKKSYINSEHQRFLYTDIFKEYQNELPIKSLINVFSRIGLRAENEHSITLVADLSWAKNGMEMRSPFLNKDILDYAASLPLTYKLRSYTDPTHNKYILKKILERYLPKEMIYQKKMWFWYSISQSELLHTSLPEIKLLLQKHRFSHEYITQLIHEEWDTPKYDLQQLLEIVTVLLRYESADLSETPQNDLRHLYSKTTQASC